MTQYALNPGKLTATTIGGQIGNSYHVGLSDGTRYYGYIFQNNGQQSSGLMEKTDVASKAALVNYGSPNLVDRDLAYYPRVTDGDFSGGGYQEVWLSANRYFDSDLDPRVPGYLQLRSQWTRTTKSAITPGTTYQVVSFNNDFFYTYGEANGNAYSLNGGATYTPSAATAAVGLDTDGTFLYVGHGGALDKFSPGGAASAVCTALNGTAVNWWVLNQGTYGHFAYYQVGGSTLYKVDLSLGAPIAVGNQVAVPMGNNSFTIIDLCAYQNGIALLTNDTNDGGFDVWFHDGTNLTRMVRMDGYTAKGISAALGDLYVGAQAVGLTSSPILAKISGGTYEVVARPGSPFPAANQGCLGPRSSGQFVYWPITAPSIKGISSATGGVVLQYDVVTGAVTHLPNQDSADFTNIGGSLRAVEALGDSVAIVFANTGAGQGILQYQTPTTGSLLYQSTGWLCSSLIDFSTPGIAKRFRRVEVKHSPLATGESILVEAFVDQDPLSFTTALSPTATSGANTTVGSTLTALTFGADTVGKTMYFAVKMGAGSGNATTPRIAYVSIEVGGTRTWELDLDCSSKRRLLQGSSEDQQGVSGKDLRYLIRNTYENGGYLTLYLANSASYTVAIESEEAHAPGYVNHQGSTVQADAEWLVHVVLRQVA